MYSFMSSLGPRGAPATSTGRDHSRVIYNRRTTLLSIKPQRPWRRRFYKSSSRFRYLVSCTRVHLTRDVFVYISSEPGGHCSTVSHGRRVQQNITWEQCTYVCLFVCVCVYVKIFIINLKKYFNSMKSLWKVLCFFFFRYLLSIFPRCVRIHFIIVNVFNFIAIVLKVDLHNNKKIEDTFNINVLKYWFQLLFWNNYNMLKLAKKDNF